MEILIGAQQMKIPPHFSFSRIERILTDLAGAGGFTLTSSLESKYHALGGEAALVQMYVTWAQQQERPQIRLMAINRPDFEDAVRKLPVLCFSLLSDSIWAGTEDVAKPLREAALNRLSSLQARVPQGVSRGSQIEIVCADHVGRPYPASFYRVPVNGEPEVRPESELGDLVELILKTTLLAEHTNGKTMHLVQPLTSAIYELFRNTDEHARLDLAGNLLNRSLRIVHARRHSINPSALKTIAADVPPLATYCTRLQPSAGKAQLQLLELSILDSGPGIASRWQGRDRSGRNAAAAEFEAILHCMKIGTSTKRHPGAGMGLPNLIATARKSNGFLRLRSGSQSLYADLGIESDRPFGALPDLKPLHGSRVPSRAAGTLWSLILPVNEAT